MKPSCILKHILRQNKNCGCHGQQSSRPADDFNSAHAKITEGAKKGSEVTLTAAEARAVHLNLVLLLR